MDIIWLLYGLTVIPIVGMILSIVMLIKDFRGYWKTVLKKALITPGNGKYKSHGSHPPLFSNIGVFYRIKGNVENTFAIIPKTLHLRMKKSEK